MKTDQVDTAKLISALNALVPVLRAIVGPFGGSVYVRGTKFDPGIRVSIPNPASSFDLTVEARIKYESTWDITAGSGSWSAADPKTLAMLAERVSAMATCDRILRTIDLADYAMPG